MHIVIPAYNEAKNIDRVLSGLFKHGFKNIVVVDDGSSDDTSKIAEQAGAVVLRHKINRGQGAALQTGHEYALMKDADCAVDFDADDQFSPADILSALEVVKKEKVDVVLGSRFLGKHSNIPWTKKNIFFPIGRFLNNLFTGVKLTDIHNGFRVLNRNALEKIQISQDGMAHNTEIVSQIKKYNLKYIEIPVEVRYHEYGQGFFGGLKIIRDLLLGDF